LEFELTESTDRTDKRLGFAMPSQKNRCFDQASQRISRRSLLERTLTLGALVAWPALGWAQPSANEKHDRPANPDLPPGKHLTESEYVYVSPLLANGRESTCHGEVWYAWLDESVVLITAKTTWKARALDRGLESARVWIGDHGRWKGWFRNNETFRRAPNFNAIATTDNDATLLDRLMKVYETKYPAEFSHWEERQRSGFHSGERIIIRYSPTTTRSSRSTGSTASKGRTNH
jgi:hypothetical protein